MNVISLVGATSANAVIEAGKILSNQVNNIEVEKIINETESKVIEANNEIIKSAFEAKRKVVKFINQTKEDHQVMIKFIWTLKTL